MSPVSFKPPMSPSPLSRSSTFDDSEVQHSPDSYASLPPSRLAREKNRLTLRSYLNSLLASSVIANSPVLRSFLLSGPITLTPDEMDDTRRREEADKLREEGRKKFAKEIANRVEGLREAVKSVKGDIMGKGSFLLENGWYFLVTFNLIDGLSHIFGTIKVTPDIRGLPTNYRAVIEWARISSVLSLNPVFSPNHSCRSL